MQFVTRLIYCLLVSKARENVLIHISVTMAVQMCLLIRAPITSITGIFIDGLENVANTDINIILILKIMLILLQFFIQFW